MSCVNLLPVLLWWCPVSAYLLSCCGDVPSQPIAHVFLRWCSCVVVGIWKSSSFSTASCCDDCPLLIITIGGNDCPLLITTIDGDDCPLLIITIGGDDCPLLIITTDGDDCPLLINTSCSDKEDVHLILMRWGDGNAHGSSRLWNKCTAVVLGSFKPSIGFEWIGKQLLQTAPSWNGYCTVMVLQSAFRPKMLPSGSMCGLQRNELHHFVAFLYFNLLNLD